MKMRMKYPASWWRNMWREALPSGNGTIGAAVYGGVQDETILINHGELWHWGRKDELPDVSHTLAETRRLMDEGRYADASWHLTNTLKERGYASRLSSRLPLGMIHLQMQTRHAFRDYERSLDMATGEVTVRWLDGAATVCRKLFVSRADDCIVYELLGREQSTGADELDDRTAERCARTRDTGSVGCTGNVGSIIGESAVPEPAVHAGSSIATDAENSPDSSGGISGMLGLRMVKSDRRKDDPAYQALENSIVTKVEDGYLFYGGRNDDGTAFGAAMRVVVTGGQRISDVQGMIRFLDAERVLVLVKVFVKGHSLEQEWARLKQQLSTISLGYQDLLERHVQLHHPLFYSAQLSLTPREEATGRCNEQLLLDAYGGQASAELIELLWHYGRYLFISGTSPDSQPFGLYGLWAGDYRLMWGHHMANENIQMMYWHAQVGGLGELTTSLYRYYNGMLDDFRDNARKLYGCRGIYIPAGTTPGHGRPNQIVPVIVNWTGAAGWLASHYVEHYRFTGDKAFLRETAWPFMKEAIAFYEDFLVMDDNGTYRIYPSVSPENTPRNHMPPEGQDLAHPMPTAINATMDLAIIKELLMSLLEFAEEMEEPEEQRRRWQEMLRRIPEYRVNEDGAVKEWAHENFQDRYEHRHLSHLYPVFPGHEIDPAEAPALYEAFAKAVRLRKLGAQTGWSLAHMASIYARLGDGEQALGCLNMLARSCLLPNLWTVHNDWRGMGISMNLESAPVQLDANMGIINAVQEMLLYVSPTRLKLLPALPSAWTQGRVQDWRYASGKISMEWDVKAGFFQAFITAERLTQMTVQMPAFMTGTPEFSGEGEYTIDQLEAGRYCFHIEAGGTVYVNGH